MNVRNNPRTFVLMRLIYLSPRPQRISAAELEPRPERAHTGALPLENSRMGRVNRQISLSLSWYALGVGGKGSPRKGCQMDTKDKRYGNIPTDGSEEMEVARLKRYRRADCTALEVPEAWEHFSFTPLADKCARLATVPEAWKGSAFAHSLAKQFTAGRTLTHKQVVAVERLYREYQEVVEAIRYQAMNHDWRRVGSITHYFSATLGTYSATDYYKCAKCDEWGANHDANNYSGD